MAVTVEELRAVVTAEVDDAVRNLRKVDDAAGKSGKGFSAAKSAVVGFATAGAAALAGKIIGAASDLNETVSKTGVVFGDQTGQVTAYAQKMADDFGLPKTAMLDAASSFGLLGQAAGVSGKPLADMSTNLAGLAADAMSFYNVPLEQALGDFSSALSGESEPVKKYGVLMNEAAVQAEALALGIAKPVKNTKELADAQARARLAQDAYNKAVKAHGKDSAEAQRAQLALGKANDKVAEAAKGTVPALTEAQKVQARYSLITKGLGKAQGDLARTQDSVANQAKALQGRVINLAADMGQKLLPAASAVLGGLMGLLDALPKVAGFVQDNATTIGVVAGIIGAILLPRLIAWGVQSTIAAAKSVAAWVTTQASAIASSWAQVGATVRVIAGWVAMGVAAGVNAAKMAAAWVLGIISQAAKSAAAMAVTVARVVAGWVLMGVQSMIQAARMAAAWLIAMGPVGWVIAAVIALVALIIANWDTVKRVTIAAWTATVDWLKGAWEWIKTTAQAALLFVLNLVTMQFRAVLAITKAVWNAVKAAVQWALNGIRNIVTTLVNGTKNVISGAWNWVKSTTSTAWSRISGAVRSHVSTLLGIVKGIPGRIRSALGNMGQLLWDSGQRIMQGLADGIRAGLGRVTGAVKSVLESARNLLPFSPAKEGPFSGRGWTLYSGRSIAEALGEGIGQGKSGVRKAALDLARSAVPRIPGVTAPGVAFGAPRAALAPSGGIQRPSQMAGGPGAGQVTNYNLTTYYPIREKESQATNRGLQRVASLTLVEA